MTPQKNLQKHRILVCGGTGCSSSGSNELLKLCKQSIIDNRLDDTHSVTLTGCHGLCEQGPVVIIEKDHTLYCRVTKNDISEIIEKHIIKNQIIDRLLYINPVDTARIVNHQDIPFYKKQQRLLLRLSGKIDPENIQEYIDNDGYTALLWCLEQNPECIIEEIKISKLRGRGGGGFPAGMKWESTRNAPGEPKYVICNADEGDPGAFMDRSIIEGNPHSVIEGMIIAAYAIGSNSGYIYVRAEYPLAIKRLRIALEQAEAAGYLGDSIVGSDFSFRITIKEGAGAFVCGESSALMHSIEGHRGIPRSRPPNSTKKGLWNKPTCLNNVETFANVPLIINMGATHYISIGTDNSTGTKVLALTGKINNTVLAEVPMGISLREIIYDIGGGIQDSKKFKAVQIGGPSGGCIPEALLDLPIDFDTLTEAGAMMGSGGLVVLDESTCMVDLAKFFLRFMQDESCGKCTPCREGTYRMLQILEKISDGQGTLEDLTRLELLSDTLINSSLCGLGKSAPNPFLSSLRYFRQEYETHINEKKCPSGVCKNLTTYSIQYDICTACTLCAKKCPSNAIDGARGIKHTIIQSQCTRCGICYNTCPFQAITMG